MNVTYDYPNGGYAETLAIFPDGRTMLIDTQYSAVLPRGNHAATCEQQTKMGGRCNCGLLDGVDIKALVADARINGKFGLRPEPIKAAPVKIEVSEVGPLCPRCHSYCYGDCNAR